MANININTHIYTLIKNKNGFVIQFLVTNHPFERKLSSLDNLFPIMQ